MSTPAPRRFGSEPVDRAVVTLYLLVGVTTAAGVLMGGPLGFFGIALIALGVVAHLLATDAGAIHSRLPERDGPPHQVAWACMSVVGMTTGLGVLVLWVFGLN